MSEELATAIEDGDFARATALVEQGADARVMIDDEPALLVVCENSAAFSPSCEEFEPMVRLAIALVEAGADLRVETYEREALLSLCFRNQFPLDVVETFIARGAPLANSSDDFFLGSLSGLVEASFSADSTDYAVSALGTLDRLAPDRIPAGDLGRCLVESFIRAQDDYSPHEADFLEAKIPFFRKLLDLGADVDARGDCEHTALMRAAMNSYPAFVAFFIEQKADPHLASESGHTALMYVSGKIDEVADPGDRFELTTSHLEIATRLLEAGADPTQADAQGKSARMRAEAAGLSQLIALFDA